AKEETPEPQNALTEKFTEEEWKALKELRSQLPDIFADAYDNKEGAKTTPITIWGVTIDPQNPTSSAKVSVVLMKFLRARNLNAAEAREMIRQTLRWRDEFKIDEVLKEEFDPEVYGNIGHIFGKDKLGHPIIYNLYGANKQAFADVPKFIRWRVQFMEKGIQLLDFETVDQMVQVHDYEGVGMRDRDQNSKNAAKEATNIFSSHYPEFLAPNGKFFVNVPTMMAWIFWIFKPLLSAATLAKMRVVGSGPKAIGKEILPFVDASELPKRYGGTAEAF
ncbi:CRAL/TRIO domain-containing protein, partial [Punctularia strigosozonata HHB-11173 SS5]|uniref:CRAL/TRIO domain-containing protein n=1 Tax=Punctularia strigosozonata (strain HHB-11173) TaxID=741275 RepID=UPI000441800D